MKAKESTARHENKFVQTKSVTLDDVERLATGNRKERRLADKLLKKAEALKRAELHHPA